MGVERRLKLQIRNGIWFVSGDLGAESDLSHLLKVTVVLRLNLRNLGEINSIGVRTLCMFLKGFQGESFEYFECPPNFLDILNMVPMLLNVNGKVGRVVSMNVPYVCSRCLYEQNILTQSLEILHNNDKFALPVYDCNQCNSEKSFEPSMPAQDILYFMSDKSV
jgi:hypothetical protein